MANYRKSFNLRNGVQVDDDNFIVNANGLVGIGTSVPSEVLHVVGNTKVSGLTTTKFLYAGIGTIDNLRSPSVIVSGVVTATAFSGSASQLTGIYAIAVDGWYITGENISTSSRVGIGSTLPTSALTVRGDVLVSGVVTAASFSGNASSATYATSAGLSTNLEINATNRVLYQAANNDTEVLPAGTSGQLLQSNGASTPSWVNPSSVTAGSATYATSAGVAGYSDFSGISTNVIGGIGSISQLRVTGLSTFLNGPVLIGSADQTGVTGHVLQVAGINSGVYVGGSLNVGDAGVYPGSKVYVDGNVTATGDVTATSFFGDGINLTGIVTYIDAGTGIYISQNTGQLTITSINAFAGALTYCCTNNITAVDLTSHPDITTAASNFFSGIGAGCSITSGFYNHFFGKNSGSCTTEGNSNTFFGVESGFSNLTGSYNNFFGGGAGYANTTGSNNNFFGKASGTENTEGINNNFIGNQSGYLNVTGSYNIFLGSYSGISSYYSRKIVIGNGSDSRLFDSPDPDKDKQLAIGSRDRKVFTADISNRTGTIGITSDTITGISTASISVGQEILCDTVGVFPTTGEVLISEIGVGELTISDTSLNLAPVTTTFDIGTSVYPTDYWIVGDESYDVGIGTTNPTAKLHVGGSLLVSGISTVGLGTTSAPSNSQLSFELTSDTNLRIRVRGTDGILRLADITLS